MGMGQAGKAGRRGAWCCADREDWKPEVPILPQLSQPLARTSGPAEKAPSRPRAGHLPASWDQLRQAGC